jgi:hypothetical protein
MTDRRLFRELVWGSGSCETAVGVAAFAGDGDGEHDAESQRYGGKSRFIWCDPS